MNPFSGFLQPQNNRPLEGLATTQDLLRTIQGNKEMAQRKLENEQQNTRANSYLAMQQADQARRFSEQDRKQVESLLAEYQQAEDQGDPVVLARAAQALKRYGMDVQQGGAKPNLQAFTGQTKPDLRALTGERLLPNVKPSPEQLQALTGQPQNPIDAAVAQELKSREALQAKNAAPEQDLSEEDFLKELESRPDLPERMERNGELTAEGRAVLPKAPDEESSDQTDPGMISAGSVTPDFDIDALASGQVGPDALKDTRPARAFTSGVDRESLRDARPGQVGGEAINRESFRDTRPNQIDRESPGGGPRLSTQLLPTVVSKGGKQLYESTGPSGRWAPMVSAVFGSYASSEDPMVAEAGKKAQDLASKLVQVDGIAPKDAIQFAAGQMKDELTRLTNLERTKIGSRRTGGGGGGGSGLMGKGQDLAESIRLYTGPAKQQVTRVANEDLQYSSMEAKLASGDPGLQRDAINELYKIRSGTAVSAAEDNRVAGLNSALDKWYNKFQQWTGGPLSPDMLRAMQEIVATKRQINRDFVQRVFDQAAGEYEDQNTGKVKDDAVFRRRVERIRKGGSAIIPGAVSEANEEDLY